MVETDDLKGIGLTSRALQEEDGDTFFLKDNWHRVCAPKGKENGKMHSLVFWNKAHPEDEASWESQVSSFTTASSSSKNLLHV